MTTSAYWRQSTPARSQGMVSTCIPRRASGSTVSSSSMTNPVGSCRVRKATRRTSGLGVEDELRAAEQCERLAALAMRDDGIPELRGPPEVGGRCDALDRALAGGVQEIGLQLDGREPVCTLGLVRDAAVAAGGVGERHDGAGVQVAVRGDVVALDREFRAQFLLGQPGDHDAHVAGQEPGAAALELLEGDQAAAPARSTPAGRSRPNCAASSAGCSAFQITMSAILPGSMLPRTLRRPSARAALRVTPRSASSVVSPNCVQARFMLSCSDASGELPGLRSLATAIGTRFTRSNSIGGRLVSRR